MNFPGLEKVDRNRYTEITKSGSSCFLRCSSCYRSIRKENMNEHWKEVHSQVRCPQCRLTIDAYHAYKHVTNFCSAKQAFCKYCAAETTKGQLYEHEDTCEYSPSPRGKLMDEINIPRNVQLKLPSYDNVFETAKAYSKVHRREFDNTVPFLMSKKFQTDFPAHVITKPLETQTIRKEIGNELLENQLFPEGKVAKARKAIDEIFKQEEFDQPKQNIRLRPIQQFPNPPKWVENKKPSTDGSPNTSRTNIHGIFGNLTKSSYPNEYANAVLSTKLPVGVETNECLGSSREETGSISMKRNMNSGGAKEYLIQKDRLAKLRQEVRKNVANTSRARAHAYAVKGRNRQMIKNLFDSDRNFRNKELQEKKMNVINQAIQLEGVSDKLSRIPKDQWTNFVHDVRKTRQVWPDLGFRLEDCSSTDEEIEIMMKRGKDIIELLKNPKNYFPKAEIKPHVSDHRVGFFTCCEFCQDFVPTDFYEEHHAKCYLSLSNSPERLNKSANSSSPLETPTTDNSDESDEEKYAKLIPNKSFKDLRSIVRSNDKWLPKCPRPKGYPSIIDSPTHKNKLILKNPMPFGRRLTPPSNPTQDDLIMSLCNHEKNHRSILKKPDVDVEQECTSYWIPNNPPAYVESSGSSRSSDVSLTLAYLGDKPKKKLWER